MKRIPLFCAALALASVPTFASVLTVSVLTTPVPQSQSEPCIICGTTQAHNPPTFGYNNFNTTGNISSLTLFSTNRFTTLGNNIEDAIPNNYTAGEIGSVLRNNFTFGVAIDVNSAEGGNPPRIMQLDSFMLLDLTQATVLAATPGPVLIPDIRPGNGKGDYLITGFDLSSVNAGDFLAFRAQFSNASDGPDSFYLVPMRNGSIVPEPSTWGLMLTGVFGIGVGLLRKRKV